MCRGVPGRGQPPPPYQQHPPRGAANTPTNNTNNNANNTNRPPSRTRAQDLYEGPLKTYKQFLETQDDHITPQEAEKKYEEYKIKMQVSNRFQSEFQPIIS